MDRKKEIQALFEQSRQSFKKAFPVSSRIQQLEAYLQDESLSHQHVNIRAALHMYKTGQLEYGYGYTLFVEGQVVPMDAIPKDLMMAPKWAEVHCIFNSLSPNTYIYLIISGQGLGTQLGSTAPVPPQPKALETSKQPQVLEENSQPEVYEGHEGNRDQQAESSRR